MHHKGANMRIIENGFWAGAAMLLGFFCSAQYLIVYKAWTPEMERQAHLLLAFR
jgi:hypothetical protein